MERKLVASDILSKLKQPTTKSKNPLLSDDCIKVLNYRIQQEEYSSRIYLAMSMWLNNTGYSHAAELWKKYSQEELSHADWSRIYLLSMGVQPATPSLEQPKEDFTGFPEIIRLSYQHEIEITKQCKEFADHALAQSDHMLYQLTLKYLAEQVEEHQKMQDMVDQLTAFGEDKIAMRLFDESL
jgi:ferritin